MSSIYRPFATFFMGDMDDRSMTVWQCWSVGGREFFRASKPYGGEFSRELRSKKVIWYGQSGTLRLNSLENSGVNGHCFCRKYSDNRKKRH